MLKDNTASTRRAAAEVLQGLLKHGTLLYRDEVLAEAGTADIRDAALRIKPASAWVEILHDSEWDVMRPNTEIFCILVNEGEKDLPTKP